ncbi:MAG: type II toxin-antitoxin system Phd/YefM family antitoxin [Mycobacteriales bacterium]
MTMSITQRELRNQTPEIMRAVENGESFTLTRNGTPIADITPHIRPGRRSMTGAQVLAAGRELLPIDPDRFRADLDAVTDDDPDREPGVAERTATAK